ncbi:hypothetical protein HPB48_005071 [Haemaphysalis longicornis]|uniref:Uncharacterized protein n=1 Tax=Haemaphysalis longicornis TaxID=44386 RepID=A0A9J6FH56_HAELO|nr:hypothetical protein HPB48_005071 [Haemaphysalis longicornis]
MGCISAGVPLRLSRNVTYQKKNNQKTNKAKQSNKQINAPAAIRTALRSAPTAIPAAATFSDPSEYAAQLRSRMEQAISLARRNLGKARAGQKGQYDKAHREVRYKAGDLVLRRNHVLSDATKGISASLSVKWSGPYRVGDALTPLVYQLVDPKGKPVGGPVNVADLKPFVARSDDWNVEAAPSLRKRPKRGVAAQRPNIHRYRLGKRA